MFDLNELSLPELKKLQKDVTKAIENFHERERRAAIAELEVVAKERGFTLAELLNETAVKPRKTVEPKYANPANRSETWSGRGRKPRWVVAALESGKSLDDLAI
ncbi:H-NS histone family protein [Roseinatronobacter sp. NSM]|uniref:H-NS histone family protein n=1 Tax=Roseinatronobacter sp. NSM TaxID=3457785 RepID=UPI0040353BAA